MTSHSPPRQVSPIILSGFATALVFLLSMAFDITMNFGGGSITRGLPYITGNLSFYGVFLCIPAIAIAFIAIVLSKLLGLRVTYSLIGCGALVIVIHSIITSHPGAQLGHLATLSNKTALPHFDYLEFKKYPTFNDGTTYSWRIRCNPEQAKQLVSQLRLVEISKESDISDGRPPLLIPDSRRYAFESVFKHRVVDEIHYTDDRHFIGGFSPTAAVFRVVWFPEGRLTPPRLSDTQQ